MSETHREPESGHGHEPEEFDRDLDVRAIVWTAVGITGMTIVSGLLMLLMMRVFATSDERHEAPRPPMAEQHPIAPAPQLQPFPRLDMELMNRQEDTTLSHAAWIDRQAGTVRLPISVAIDLVAERGLPAAPASGMSMSMDRGPTNQVSPGTVLPGPGQGVGQLGPSAAAPMSQSGRTTPATDASRGTPVPMPAPGESGTGTAAGPGRKPPGGVR
jgi:hypothetical protein